MAQDFVDAQYTAVAEHCAKISFSLSQGSLGCRTSRRSQPMLKLASPANKLLHP